MSDGKSPIEKAKEALKSADHCGRAFLTYFDHDATEDFRQRVREMRAKSREALKALEGE